MSILHHRLKVRNRWRDREEGGRCSQPHMFARASSSDAVDEPVAAEPVPRAAPRKRKAKAKRRRKPAAVA